MFQNHNHHGNQLTMSLDILLAKLSTACGHIYLYNLESIHLYRANVHVVQFPIHAAYHFATVLDMYFPMAKYIPQKPINYKFNYW